MASRDGRLVLDDVTLPVARGRITVLVGPSAVGKTTCVRLLVGLDQPSHGRALIEGRDIAEMPVRELRQQRRRMSVMLQGSTLFNCGVFWSLSVFDNVAFPLRERESLSEDRIAALVGRRLTDLQLAVRADAMPAELSAGMVRRLALARALVSGSDIVVLDDVESGIEAALVRRVGRTIRSVQRESGATFLVVTHDAELARECADVLAVMRRGRIEALGPPDDLLRDPTSFPARFLEGDQATGLGMADEPTGA